MKTDQLRSVYKELSGMNNAFTHYYFIWTQFNLDYADEIKTQPDSITEDCFQNNRYSPKHSVKLNELPNEHEKTHRILTEGIFVLMFSIFESYLKDVFEMAQTVDSSISDLEKKIDAEEDTMLIDKIVNRLAIEKGEIGEPYFDTFDYLRLKRNRLIHQSAENISRTVKTLIKYKGKHLNSFWNATLPKGLQGIDFSSQEAADLVSFEVLIDALNIIRGLASKIDQSILKRLGHSNFIEKEAVRQFLTKINKEKSALLEPRTQRKFLGYCETKYGFRPDKRIMQDVVDGIA